MHIIIDNGHGNDTPGKRSPVWADGSQLFEYEFNRKVAEIVFNFCRTAGVDATLLVPELYDVSLVERVRRANKISLADPEAFLISIHANAGGGTGWEIFTSPGETMSDKIATIFAEFAEKMLSKYNFRTRKDLSDGDPDKESLFYILRKTICPAILTENLFMDTERDCRFIMSREGVGVIASIHINAIQYILGL